MGYNGGIIEERTCQVLGRDNAGPDTEMHYSPLAEKNNEVCVGGMVEKRPLASRQGAGSVDHESKHDHG